MDAKFYQFWEDFVKQAAGGNVDPNVFSGWMNAGTGMPDELMDMFKKYYGLDQLAADAPDYSEMFDSAISEFNRSLTNWFSVLNVVPKTDYLELEKKYKALKRKVADQEEVIQHLKLLFKTNPPNVEEGIGALNKMLKSQNENFLKMMDSLAGFYGIEKNKDADNE